MADQQQLRPGLDDAAIPSLEIAHQDSLSDVARENWKLSGLDVLGVPCEEWSSAASNRALRYFSHGLFRYFGKFPPLVARHLISAYTKPGDTVLDPMIGCGTTAVEALLLQRHCVGLDVNPLSILLTKVKSHRSDAHEARSALAAVMSRVAKRHPKCMPDPSKWPTSIRTEHWFLPETSHWLQLLREAIAEAPGIAERELLQVAYAGILRKVSRATSQQGRLFLDVETAEPDPRKRFETAVKQAIAATAALPPHKFNLELHEASSKEQDFTQWQVPLIICHPPYFNVYKYSSILSLEAAWLGHDIKSIQKREIREFFKIGKPDNVTRYVDDMQLALRRIAAAMQPRAVLALMVGDTAIHGQRIQTTRLLAEAVSDVLVPTKVAVRTPKFTEASWAASQRRTGDKVGVAITDFVVHFRRRS